MLGYAAFVLLCFLWGSTWLVIKVGYGGLGPFNVAALRFFVAGFLLVPLVPMLGARWPRGRDEWRLVVFVGIVLFGADYGLIYWGEQWLDSGLTAVLFAVLPIITVLLAHIYLPGERLTIYKLAGTLLAFAGVATLFADNLQLDASKTWPMLAIVLSTACAGASSIATKRYGHALHPVAFNAPAMLVGGACLALASLIAGDGLRAPVDLQTWGAIFYLAIAGSVVTFLIFFWLLKTWSATTLSFISVFTPITALALGYLVLQERPTAWTALGATVVLMGVVLAQGPRK